MAIYHWIFFVVNRMIVFDGECVTRTAGLCEGGSVSIYNGSRLEYTWWNVVISRIRASGEQGYGHNGCDKFFHHLTDTPASQILLSR